MAEEKRLRVINISEVETTILPHEGLKGGEKVIHPTVEQMGWDTVEIGTGTQDPGHGYVPGVSVGGEQGGVEWPLESTADQVIYILRGETTFYWGDNEKTTVREGDFVFIPKGMKMHKLTNEGSEQMFAVYAFYSPDFRGYMKEHRVG